MQYSNGNHSYLVISEGATISSQLIGQSIKITRTEVENTCGLGETIGGPQT